MAEAEKEHGSTNGAQKMNPNVRHHGAYQGEIYAKGMFHNIKPVVTTDPNKLEAQAKGRLTEDAYNYVAGGAGERATMDANRLAFRQWKLIPRMLRNNGNDLSVTLFGQKYKTPIICAPVGVLSIFHPDAETGVAQIASELDIPYTLSTASTSSIEDVAKASGDGPRWYQLYWPLSNDVTKSLLSRAQDNGYSVLLVTLDTFSLAWRPWDLDNGYIPFVKGVGNKIGMTDPVFQKVFREQSGKTVEEDIVGASMAWQKDVFAGNGHSWEQIAFLRENWKGPIVLKGIQAVEDALKAVEVGVDGIVVSNHGGRQLDGAIGSLDVLPEIAQAVGNKITVLFDSGIRTGVDIIKALCLGAKGVLVGRPWVYGLGIAGKDGAKEILRGMLADLDQSLLLSGIGSVNQCDRSWVRRVQYPGDVNSNR